MKKLEKLLLVNWHNFELECLEFGTLNFLTGKNATGKSTIIDALQLVILGDGNGQTFFNKAASTKSSRTLEGYLYGEQGDDEGAGFRYRRQGPFSSYVAAVWRDSLNGRCFTSLFMADCHQDHNFDRHWMTISSDATLSLFLGDDDVPLDFRLLKSRLSGKVDYKVHDAAYQYQAALCAALGNINKKYMSLLRKAVPFTPITDMVKFITESICDIDSSVDISNMQTDIRNYTELEETSAIATRRLKDLEAIASAWKDYLARKETVRIHEYVLQRARVDAATRLIAELKEQLAQCEARVAEILSASTLLEGQRNEVEEREARLSRELHSSSAEVRRRQLEEGIAERKERIALLERRLDLAVGELSKLGRHLTAAMAVLDVKDDDLSLLAGSLSAMDSVRVHSLDLAKAAQAGSDVSHALENTFFDLTRALEGTRAQLGRERAILSDLEKGMRPYPEAVRSFLALIRNGGIGAAVLCEKVEVVDLDWHDSLEALLDDHRFDILIESGEDYRKAYDLLMASGRGGGVTLVDLSALEEEEGRGLASHLSADDGRIRSHLNHLLSCYGQDAQADTELHSWTRSLLCRHDEALSRSPFLGRSAITIQMERCRAAIARMEEEESRLIQGLERLCKARFQPITEDNMRRIEEDITASRAIGGLKEELSQLALELEGIDMLYLERLRAEIDECRMKKKDLEERIIVLSKEDGAQTAQLEELRNSRIPAQEEVVRSLEEGIKVNFDKDWIAQVGERSYADALREKRTISLEDAYDNSLKGFTTRMEKAFSEVVARRADYNNLYRAAHDSTADDNEAYEEERRSLAEVKLPEYRERIKEAKEAAYRQFREDFISKIKSKIEDVRIQIGKLNSALAQSVFGRDRYHFSVLANPDYRQFYNMFMDEALLDVGGGLNLYSESFFEKYKMEIDELFDKLIVNDSQRASAERMAQYEKDLARYTDYRTYLVFDLIVEDRENGSQQRLSRTLLKKSGGETQLPFYIALLASFSQVCRIGQKNPSTSNTVRLVIFDEAFSKMDAERIRESIRLLGRFGLQAIFSAPSDKIGDIAPLVDNILVTFRDNKHSFVRRFEPGELKCDE